MKLAPITLINPGGMYELVVSQIVSSIADHIGGINLRTAPLPGTFNVHFFRELKEHDTGAPRQCTDLYISHGWFQKLVSNYWKQIHNFRYIGVPGPMLKGFLVNKGYPAERILTVGHPGLDYALTSGRPAPTSDKPKLVVAYSHSSFIGVWKRMPNLFKKRLAEWFDVVEVIHPAHSNQLARLELRNASVCFTDISGTMFEAWAFGVPVVFPSWSIGDEAKRNEEGCPLQRVYGEKIGYHVDDHQRFLGIAAQAAEEGITPAEVSFIDEYFPRELRGHSGKAAAEAILRVV